MWQKYIIIKTKRKRQKKLAKMKTATIVTYRCIYVPNIMPQKYMHTKKINKNTQIEKITQITMHKNTTNL